MASEIINHTPRSNGSDKSPIEIFTSSHVRPKLSHFHTFGCPVYVLENSLQSGKSAGKWNPRSRVGIYLGQSPRHARSVSLVLNPRTGLVSPQWHVKHDEMFETVINREIEDSHGNWKRLGGFVLQNNQTTKKRVLRLPTNTMEIQDIDKENEVSVSEGADNIRQNTESMSDHLSPQEVEPVSVSEGDDDRMIEDTTIDPTTEPNVRRSKRQWKPTTKVLESMEQKQIALPMEMEVLKSEYAFENELEERRGTSNGIRGKQVRSRHNVLP